MTSFIELTDVNENAVHIDLDNIESVMSFQKGSIQFFHKDNTPCTFVDVTPGEEQVLFDVIQDEMNRLGYEMPILHKRPDEYDSAAYTAMFDVDSVNFFAFQQPNPALIRIKNPYKTPNPDNAPTYLYTYDDGLAFNPDSLERDAFLAAIRVYDKQWLHLSPDEKEPNNTTGAEYFINKNAIENVAGYLLGKVIFDLKDGRRLFVPIEENPDRTQHIEIAKQIGMLKPIGGEHGKTYINPDHFDPDKVRFQIIDWGEGKKNALLIYEDWHLPFPTLEDAAQAVNDFVRTYQNDPQYSVNLTSAPVEPDDFPVG
ncbi:MAG: hypothetical protein ACLFR0_05870 [Alphaproteobacteria bacterium]